MALIFEDDKSDFLPTLHELFKYESLIVAGPHGGRPKFQPWSVDDVVNSTANIKEEDLVALIDELIKTANYGDSRKSTKICYQNI